MLADLQRESAQQEAYGLFEAVQRDRHPAAVATLPAAVQLAEHRGWPEVGLILTAAQTVHALGRPDDLGPSAAEVAKLVERAEQLEAPALLALALGLRAVASSITGDTAGLLADVSQAVALLDDERQPPLDRSAGYVVAAAALRSLRLWELVDELYSRADEIETHQGVGVQAPAVAANRVRTRLEWGLALLENDDEDQARLRLRQAATAVRSALDRPLPPLCRRDVQACAEVVALLCGEDPALGRHVAADDDCDVRPVRDAAAALALLRSGQLNAAVVAAQGLLAVDSASSVGRSFPLWVRAQVLAAAQPSPAVRAQQAHAALLGRQSWQSRQALLVAARSQIEAARRQGRDEWLSRGVNTDVLTGLHNRVPLDAWLGRRSTGNRPTALLLLDLDDFAAINDTYGRACGDEVLRRLGKALLGWVRPGDLAVRRGGDEFAVLFEDERLTVTAVWQRARQLQGAIVGAPWAELASGLVVTASIGMAVALAAPPDLDDGGLDTARLYRDAGAALLAAKREGSGLRIAPGV